MQAQVQIPASTSKIQFEGADVYYETAEQMARWRVDTLFEKEPDTIEWLRQMKPGEIFVDIGANVGMYSILAAKAKHLRVYAFEPESQNYALLNRNIFLNGVQDTATAFPIALSDRNQVDRLYLSQFSTGGSCHQFGSETNFKLQPIRSEFAQGCVSFTLDRLIAEGVIPAPNHIKIDVDGIEHLVINGARGVLNNPQLRSVLIEINTNLPQHRELIGLMQELGFTFDKRQVDSSTRQEGAFKGCGNYIFWRKTEKALFDFSSFQTFSTKEVISYITRRIEEADLITDPYPHFIVSNFFPDEFYKQMLLHRLDDEQFDSLAATGRAAGDMVKNRYILRLDKNALPKFKSPQREFWTQFSSIVNSYDILNALVSRYHHILVQTGRISESKTLNVYPENLLVRDRTNYAIGPHSDAPHRLLSMLVYLPPDDSLIDLGTSVYRPKDPNFRCEGGPHYNFESFDRVKTAPFLPNTAFCFLKTNNSFHGVEPITKVDIVRDSLCYIARINGSNSKDDY